MKERELRDSSTCGICHNKFGVTGSPFFFRVRIERYMLNARACQRQQGLGLMIGVALAQVMGPDDDLADKINSKEFTVCWDCAINHETCVAALEETAEESQAQQPTAVKSKG